MMEVRRSVSRHDGGETKLLPYLRFGLANMFLLEEELSVQIADINRVQIDLQEHTGLTKR